MAVSCVVEGPVDAAVIERICDCVDVEIANVAIKGGKSKIIPKLRGYDAAGRFSPWLVLLDLDQDDECGGAYAEQLLPAGQRSMLLRIAVRQVEAWLLADAEAFADHFAISLARMPAEPEAAMDAKLEVVNLARSSRRRAVREDMVPNGGSGHKVGGGYTLGMIEFIRDSWRPEVAASRAESLARCIRAVEKLA